MQLSEVAKSRSGLVQLLIVLIMSFLGLIMVLSYRQEGYAVEILTILGLAACLYVMARERRLGVMQSQLIAEVLAGKKQLQWLGKKLEIERHESTDMELRFRELTHLYRAISTVNAVMDFRSTFDTVLRAALDLVDGDCGSIMLLDEGASYLVMVSARGLGDDVRLGQRQPADSGVAGSVVHRGEPLLLSGDLDADGSSETPASLATDRGEDFQRRSISMNVAICCPLALRGEIIGVLNVGVSTEGERKEFSDYDLRSVAIFAQHSAIAIENARLLERTDLAAQAV